MRPYHLVIPRSPPAPPPQATTDLLSVSMELPALDISQTWNQTLLYDDVKAHPCCGCIRAPFLFVAKREPICLTATMTCKVPGRSESPSVGLTHSRNLNQSLRFDLRRFCRTWGPESLTLSARGTVLPLYQIPGAARTLAGPGASGGAGRAAVRPGHS